MEKDKSEGGPSLTGSLSFRIVALRDYCIRGLGNESFTKVYKYMKEKSLMGDSEEQENSKLENELRTWIKPDQMDEYLSLIAQLIFCEESMA